MSQSPNRPEILAPVGDRASLLAALEAGADAVYLGLDEGFNARGRATNFPLDGLEDLVAEVHRGGARLLLTLNTLVFDAELEAAEAILRAVGRAGVDAIIVQDPAIALLAQVLAPDVAIHASTQMTISSAEGARFARSLGAVRFVAPRELSVKEIAKLTEQTDLEVEVFVHGALCVSWSGQCLTSEAWGGRSANRGQCTQSCRMPYSLFVDGELRDLGEVKYLLSPADLAAVRAVPDLVAAGVASLKIEGRLKGADYVGATVGTYRRERRAAVDGVARSESEIGAELTDLGLAYTRGFSNGFLHGSDHQTLVDGRHPKNRGLFLGTVTRVLRGAVDVRRGSAERPWNGALGLSERPEAPTGPLAAPLEGELIAEPPALKAGMGVGFDGGRPEMDEVGGPVFSVETHLEAGGQGAAAGWTLGFGRPGPDLSMVSPGDRVWLTSDPALGKRIRERRLAQEGGKRPGRWPVSMRVSGSAAGPMTVVAQTGPISNPVTVTVVGEAPLASASQRGLDADLLRDKLGALGGTPYVLGDLDATGLDEGLRLPVSKIKALRRAAVTALDAAMQARRYAGAPEGPALPSLRARALAQARVQTHPMTDGIKPAPRLIPLCRTDAQLDAILALGFPEVELDWMEMVGLGNAFRRAKAAGLSVTIATVRVQKPGEEGYDKRIAKLKPDAVLVRHWGALIHFLESGDEGERPVLHGDFSLNVTNALTAGHLFGMGLETLTCAHDLDRAQALTLVGQTRADRMTVTLHHHIATFHTEHCVFAHTLSNGRDFKSCGRPCEAHEIGLRDHRGNIHPVVADVGCRNTVFNAQAQSAASMVPALLKAGVRRFRVELVRETEAETRTVLEAYRELLAGNCRPGDAAARASAHEQFGVSAGTMRVLKAPEMWAR